MYTYKILKDGYEILKNSVPYIIQTEPFIPNKSLTYEENAKAQIEELMEIKQPQPDMDMEQNQAIAELTMMIATPTE